MRTVGSILLGCVLASVGILVASIAWLGTSTGVLVAVAIAVAVVATYVVAIGPWQRRWGATEAEVSRRMPGDELLPAGAASTTRAVEIHATPPAVFPWLRQIGFGRGGWYSYDWIDNDGRPSVGTIEPALWLEVGDRIEMLPGVGPIVREIVPDHCIVSAGDSDSWCLLLESTTDGDTRLISRWRQAWPHTIATRLWIAIVDPGAFIMERKMLRTIRDLAERHAHDQAMAST
jgi:hypothetical protein